MMAVEAEARCAAADAEMQVCMANTTGILS
jgi:hypothetical protein